MEIQEVLDEPTLPNDGSDIVDPHDGTNDHDGVVFFLNKLLAILW